MKGIGLVGAISVLTRSTASSFRAGGRHLGRSHRRLARRGRGSLSAELHTLMASIDYTKFRDATEPDTDP